MKNRKILAIIVIVPIIIALLASMLYSHVRQMFQDKITIKVDTVTVMDTIPYLMPVARDSVVVRYVVKQFPINRRDTARNCQDMARNIQDTATVTIPITQKRYSDSTYTAWVSGYEAQLDSIEVYQRTQTIYNTVTERRKIPPWGIGITAGYGVGKRGLTPYIGIGVTYRLFGIGGSK